MNPNHHSLLPMIGRFVLGATWITGAVVNALWTLPVASGVFADLAETATFAGYRWFFDTVVGAAPAFMALLLIFGELTLGVMILGRDPWARTGVALSVAWCVFLFFLIWPYTLSTVALLALSAWLLRYDHAGSALGLLRHRGVHDHLHKAGT